MARSLLLLLLIAVVCAGGLLWFDYLNVIDIKTVLAPIYKLIGLEGRSQGPSSSDEFINIDAERLAVRLEALDLHEMEITKRNDEISGKESELEQKAAELEDRQKGLDEREQSLNAFEDAKKIRDRNIDQIARYLNGMPPQNAVNTLLAMDDQQAIDVIRKTEEIAQAEGTASIVSFWFSLMPAQRAADIQRKMVERPE